MSKVRRLIAIGITGLLLCTVVGPAFADDIEQKQQELERIQQQMEVQQNRTNQAQRKVSNVSEQLRAVQDELDTVQREYSAIQAQRQITETQIKLNTEILAKTQSDLETRSKVLNKRMRDIYENGQVNYLDVLLGSADFGDFTTRMDVLKRVLGQDVTLISKVKAERLLVIQKKEELERDRLLVIELQKAAAAKRQLVDVRRQERQAVLDSAVNERDTAERAYQELLETSRQIEQMIRNAQAGNRGGASGSGAMIWPITGEITSPFGWRTHPIFGTARYHSGIDIAADYGDPVVAADGGVVIYADWMGGYGKAVIIDHGNGISTLYGHNSELLVSEGQRVRKGQTISRAGSTGYSTGPHVHFEVRQDGSPVSPLNYLP